MATYTNRKVQEIHLYGSTRLGTYKVPYEPDPTDPNKQIQKEDFHKLILGRRNYELSNHLGNVLAVISDKKILNGTTFEPDVVSANDYYPFGMTIESRSFSSEEYRFFFNGQERDTEININIHHAEFWKYDARTARRWNTDPITYPWQDSYTTFNNNSILYQDPLGLFGTRKEARKARKKYRLGGRIRKDFDGIFSID